MGAKRINLTLNPAFHDALLKKANERAMTPIEYIYETLRNRVFSEPVRKSKAGRPKKADDPFIEHFTRSR